jgi:hypothetical protein
MPTVDAPTGNGLADNLINPNPKLCGHDGQRKRVAHMPTATTSTAVSKSKSGDIHPLECAMKQFYRDQLFSRQSGCTQLLAQQKT